MKKLLLTYILLFISFLLVAQHTDKPTQAFVIEGKTKGSKTIHIDDLKKFKSTVIGDVTITNHKGEAKGVAKSLQGVLLKDILESIALDAESPKLFSEYYFTCIASDGYKVVFSWNEIFNTATGNSIYIVTQKDDKSITSSDESILMISSQDYKTGRRYVKNLEKIIVRKAE